MSKSGRLPKISMRLRPEGIELVDLYQSSTSGPAGPPSGTPPGACRWAVKSVGAALPGGRLRQPGVVGKCAHAGESPHKRMLEAPRSPRPKTATPLGAHHDMRPSTRLLSLPLLLSGAALADTPAPGTAEALLALAKASVQDITTDELAALIKQDPKVAVVDIRTRREAVRLCGWAAGRQHRCIAAPGHSPWLAGVPHRDISARVRYPRRRLLRHQPTQSPGRGDP